MAYSLDQTQAIRALIDVDYEAVIALLSTSLAQHHQHRVISTPSLPYPLSTYDLGIQCIPDEEFSSKEDVAKEPLLFTQPAGKLVKHALRQARVGATTKLKVWPSIEGLFRQEDERLFVPPAISHFDEKVLLSKGSREGTLKLGETAFDLTNIGDLAPVAPSLVKVDVVPDYEEARSELLPLEKLYSNDLKFKDEQEQMSVIDLVLNVTSRLKSATPLDVDSLLSSVGPDLPAEPEPVFFRSVSPPLMLHADNGDKRGPDRHASSSSIAKLVSGLMEVPFAQQRWDAQALARVPEGYDDIDTEDSLWWQENEVLDSPSDEFLILLKEGEDKTSDILITQIAEGRASAVPDVAIPPRKATILTDALETRGNDLFFFGYDVPLFPRSCSQCVVNSVNSLVHSRFSRQPPLHVDQEELDRSAVLTYQVDSRNQVQDIIRAEQIEMSGTGIMMLPIPLVSRRLSSDLLAYPSLPLTMDALIGGEGKRGQKGRCNSLLKPLSGLKSLNIELSNVWHTAPSEKAALVHEAIECSSSGFEALENAEHILHMTIEELRQKFDNLEQQEGANLGRQRLAESTSSSPVLSARNDLRSEQNPDHPILDGDARLDADRNHDRLLRPTLGEEAQDQDRQLVTLDDADPSAGVNSEALQFYEDNCLSPPEWQRLSCYANDKGCWGEPLAPDPTFQDNLHPEAGSQDISTPCIQELDTCEEGWENGLPSLSSILPEWATQRRGWMDVLDDSQGADYARETAEDADSAALYDRGPYSSDETILDRRAERILASPLLSLSQPIDQIDFKRTEVPSSDARGFRKRQAIDSIAEGDDEFMKVVKRLRERKQPLRSAVSSIDMFLRMTGKLSPPPTAPQREEAQITPRLTVETAKAECTPKVGAIIPADPPEGLSSSYTAPSDRHHYLVSLRGLQNHRVTTLLSGRCNVSLVEVAGYQDDWDWDLALDATSAVILFKISLLPAAMRAEATHCSSFRGVRGVSGMESGLDLKQMLQNEQFDGYLVLLEAYSSSGRKVEQTQPLLLAQEALRHFISQHLGASKNVQVSVVCSPLEAAISIRRWGEELQRSAAEVGIDTAEKKANCSDNALLPAMIWEIRESWLEKAGCEDEQEGKKKLQRLGLSVFASTIILAVRGSLQAFLSDPPEYRRDTFAAVLGRARMNKLNARLKREEGAGEEAAGGKEKMTLSS